MAANVQGSLKTSGRFRNEKCDRAPVPSKQIIPAPMPPIGNATRLSRSPAYFPYSFDGDKAPVEAGEDSAADASPPASEAPTAVAKHAERTSRRLNWLDLSWLIKNLLRVRISMLFPK
jgi:hypothetical protein